MAGQYISVSSSQSTNEAGNQSTVYVSMTLYSNGWSFDGYTTYYGLRIGDQWSTGVGVRTLYNPNSWTVSWSRTYNHDANGFRGAVDTEAYFDGTGPYMPDYLSAGGGTQGAIDYDRKPAAPSTVSVTVNADKSVSVTSNAVTSLAGTATYYVGYRTSSDGGSNFGSWSSYTTIPSNARTYTYTAGSLTYGLTYQFRMYASNSDGSSAATTSNSPSTVFLPAGGKRFDGSTWNPTGTAKRFDGTNWNTLTVAKRFDGTSWVDMT